MRIHRFYIAPGTIQLKHDFWLHDLPHIHQWKNVLRYQTGQEIVLFDGVESERLYRITELSDTEAHLELVTDFERQLPEKDVYLLWALLKKDKNDWVLQKATELGVNHFVPILAERSEKTGFNTQRAEKIIIEAAEQCGRSNIPSLREPMLVKTVLDHLGANIPLVICEQGGNNPDVLERDSLGLLVGPEGGWSDEEKQLFAEFEIPHIGLGNFTLRAETASVAAAAHVLLGK